MSLSFRLSTRRFGELLIERGWITPDQLAQALRSRQDPRERLGQTLVRLGLLKERDVTELLGEQFSLPVAEAEQLSLADPSAVQLVPEHLARVAHRGGPLVRDEPTSRASSLSSANGRDETE